MRRARRPRQRGAALLLAMVILTLVTTLAAGMVWQQWRAIQVETAERARTQAAWILTGALDWARLILREDARTGGSDHLGEPWAVPLAEARLSTFLAADRTNASESDGPDAFLSGSIEDAQAHYNLRNLVTDGKVVPEELRILQRLCESAGVPTDTAQRIAEGLRDAWAQAPDAPVAPQSVSELEWLGIDRATLDRLRPWIHLLPERTAVNLNTAPREVLAAAIEGLDLGSAQRLVESRQRDPFDSPEKARTQLGGRANLDFQAVGVSSTYFIVRGRLRLGDRVLEEESLLQRRQLEIVPLARERVSHHLGGR